MCDGNLEKFIGSCINIMSSWMGSIICVCFHIWGQGDIRNEVRIDKTKRTP